MFTEELLWDLLAIGVVAFLCSVVLGTVVTLGWWVFREIKPKAVHDLAPRDFHETHSNSSHWGG